MTAKKETAKATGKISETGHARNVAAFEAVVTYCKGLGTKYNPVKESLKLDRLTALHQQALLALVNLKIEQTALNNATNERQQLFKEMKPLATRLINALAATDATEGTMKDARGINQKLQGQRATKTKPVVMNGAEEESRKISVSQQSYDNLLEHFTRLAELLKQQPQYKPNEPELNNDGVANMLKQYSEANSKVTRAYNTWAGSRIHRDRQLYDPLTGMVAVAQDVKKYIKSVFGAGSAEFKQVNGIELKSR